MKLKILDLFCGAGGAAMGYYRGFTAMGLDVKSQKRYPFQFIQADAMAFDLTGYDFIHASPPCQEHSIASNVAKTKGTVFDTGWMLAATERKLKQSSAVWVIENVQGAKMNHILTLCGSMFGINVRRHRKFASNVMIFGPGPCRHTGNEVGLQGSRVQPPRRGKNYRGKGAGVEVGRAAMDIEWMTLKELCQAIPPAYTEYLARQIAPIFQQDKEIAA